MKPTLSRQILRYGSSKVQYKTIHTGLDKKNTLPATVENVTPVYVYVRVAP